MRGRAIAIAVLAVAAGTRPAGAETPHADLRRELTFADAVRVALAQNGDLYVARADVELARDDIAIARSVFDAHVVGSLRGLRESQPGNAFRFAWTDTAVTSSLEYDGRTESGLTYGLGIGAVQDRYANPFITTYNPATTATLTLTLDQPLLRGSGREANLAAINVAAKRANVTEQELRRRLEDLVSEVEVAYWNLALAYKEVEARQSSLKLAEDQVSESTRLHKLGSISELDITEAQAGVERNKQQLVAARQAVIDAEGKLRAVIIGAPDWQPDETLVPIDSPDAPPPSYSIDEHLQLARKNRSDIAVAHAAIEAEQTALAAAHADLAPQLDLVASAGLIGFSGTLAQNYATSAVYDTTVVPPYVPDSKFEGGPATALKNLATAGNYMVTVGLKLDLPVHNTAARTRYERQEHEVARARLAERTVLAQVENEVRTSIRLLQSDDELRTASDRSVAVNQELLAGVRKRFTAGALTSFDVLRVADEVARAQIAAARARVSYQVSLARLARADGTLLDTLHITTGSLAKAK